MSIIKSGRKVAVAAALVAGITVGLAAPAAFAQSVQMGGTTLDLGTSRANAMGEAGAAFNLSPSNVAGEYFLYPKAMPLNQNGSSGQPQPVGSITISGDRLVRVTRNLGSFRSANGSSAIENLIEAFAQAPNRGATPAVHTDTSMSGDASTSRVYFSYPDRVIQVLVFQPIDRSIQATVDISEQYALPVAGGPVAQMPPSP